MQLSGRASTRGRKGHWFLHHDNAPSDTSFVVKQFLAERNILVITVLSDLAPSDLWLFPNLEMGLKRTRLATVGDIKSNAAELRKIPKESFRGCIRKWINGASVCVRARVSY
jgi:hypothetical protein